MQIRLEVQALANFVVELILPPDAVPNPVEVSKQKVVRLEQWVLYFHSDIAFYSMLAYNLVE